MIGEFDRVRYNLYTVGHKQTIKITCVGRCTYERKTCVPHRQEFASEKRGKMKQPEWLAEIMWWPEEITYESHVLHIVEIENHPLVAQAALQEGRDPKKLVHKDEIGCFLQSGTHCRQLNWAAGCMIGEQPWGE